MKRILLILILTQLPLAGSITAQSPSVQTEPESEKVLRTMKNTAFAPGEKLRFRVHYGFIDAGEATLEIKQTNRSFQGRPTFHIVGTGKTVGAFDWFFKVRDRYETYIDREAMIPWYFIRRVDEGGYIINEDISFNHFRNTVSVEKSKNKKPAEKYSFTLPDNIQDMVSAFYYARNVDISGLKVGESVPVKAFIDNEIVSLDIKFTGRETIKTRLGSYNCLKFAPQLQSGRVFKGNDEMTVWISDDQNRVPVRLESAIMVGSIKMDLVEHESLRYPLNKAK